MLSHCARLFRFERAVTVYGRLQLVPEHPEAAEGAAWRWRRGEVLRRLLRGAELLLEQRGETASGLCTVVASSLGFWILFILFVNPIPPRDLLFFLLSPSSLTRSPLASRLCSSILLIVTSSNTSLFLSAWLFPISFIPLSCHLSIPSTKGSAVF